MADERRPEDGGKGEQDGDERADARHLAPPRQRGPRAAAPAHRPRTHSSPSAFSAGRPHCLNGAHPERVGLAQAGGGSGKTSSELDAVATVRPCASSTSPSAKATRRPGFTTRPIAVSGPLVACTGAQVVHLQLDRRVGDPGRQRRVHRAAGDGVQQRAHQPAVDDADRVVDRLVEGAAELDPALLERADVELHEHRDRRRREDAVADGLHRLQPGPLAARPRR